MEEGEKRRFLIEHEGHKGTKAQREEKKQSANEID